ncbi:hypothetical protein FUU19_24245 [Serratia sp. Lou2A]|uniref:Uncharacterized protein n=1 Tax=Serratia montpellierensis TaxID=2598730 RepID=A0ABS8J8F5_9GAMM|nr:MULTISPECIES: hypothetical protein [unclassified Serratia (in: enterobacteria)]MCC7586590.1 hypothetical protein [Serratia sp. Lou2A]MCC7660295.1 hypothetical protein [Serratia sp. Pon4B]HAY0630385.1 hypothetical protein [Serratia marcescens]
MGAIKITPDNVAPGNGPKYSVITIGVSNGALPSKRPSKTADRLFFGTVGLLPIVRASCLLIYFSACQNMSAEFIFYRLSHSLIIIFARRRAITRRA